MTKQLSKRAGEELKKGDAVYLKGKVAFKSEPNNLNWSQKFNEVSYDIDDEDLDTKQPVIAFSDAVKVTTSILLQKYQEVDEILKSFDKILQDKHMYDREQCIKHFKDTLENLKTILK